LIHNASVGDWPFDNVFAVLLLKFEKILGKWAFHCEILFFTKIQNFCKIDFIWENFKHRLQYTSKKGATTHFDNYDILVTMMMIW
jgi:hypothetical protein